MTRPVCEVLLTEEALEFLPLSGQAEAGAIVDFWGVVRESEGYRKINGLTYEAHSPMAEHQLRAIAEAAHERFELHEIIVHHRIGFVSVGEASLLVRVGTGHRAEGFRASQWIVDELKKRVPIWKNPVFAEATMRPVELRK